MVESISPLSQKIALIWVGIKKTFKNKMNNCSLMSHLVWNECHTWVNFGWKRKLMSWSWFLLTRRERRLLMNTKSSGTISVNLLASRFMSARLLRDGCWRKSRRPLSLFSSRFRVSKAGSKERLPGLQQVNSNLD